MIIAFKSEDIPQKVYDEVGEINVGGTLSVRKPSSLQDVMSYIFIYSHNHSNGAINFKRKLKTKSFKIESFEEPKPHIKIEFLCIDQVLEIDSLIFNDEKKRDH